MVSREARHASSRLEAVPRINCGYYPTPLEELPRLREATGMRARLLIKRDDLTGTGFGGNKVRKLDYAIAQAVEDGHRTIVTIAGEKSNHARVTAAVCARLGLRCVLVLNRAAPGTIPEGFKPASRFVYEMLGAEAHWVESREEREPAAQLLIEKLRSQGERVAYLPLGVSYPLGALGYVRAVREMLEQCDRMGARPNYIFHASTSGGTQAGIIAGCQLFGRGEIKVVGISPDDSAAEVAGRVAGIVNGLYRLLGAGERQITPEQVVVLDRYIGAGYGLDTPESIAAGRLMALSEGIILDPAYTSKTAAAMFDWINKEKLTERDTVLFWHTGGQLGHFYVESRKGERSGEYVRE